MVLLTPSFKKAVLHSKAKFYIHIQEYSFGNSPVSVACFHSVESEGNVQVYTKLLAVGAPSLAFFSFKSHLVLVAALTLSI